MTKTVKLEPAEEKIEEQKPEPKEENFFINIPESEAQDLMGQLIDLCVIYQSIPSLPDASKIERDTNFYIEEVFRILFDHGLITH